jgi:nicotinate-nucleotide adenylyltransferase
LKRIGIYGGTFDPIHHAHLILAREALERLELDEVIFVPAAMSPHKLDQTPTDAAARVEMIRAAIKGEPRFCIDEIELQRPPPSFTIETIESYVAANADAEIHYLVGSDNLPRLQSWYRFADLQRLVRFVVLNRGAKLADCPYELVERQVDISATQIRNRVATGRSIRYLVPPAVEEIIHRRQLYTEPTR